MVLMIDGKPAEKSFGQTVKKMETEMEGFQRRVRARNNLGGSGFTAADLKAIQMTAKAMQGAFGTSFAKIDADAVRLSKNINASLSTQLNAAGKSATDNGRKIEKALVNPQAERGVQRLGDRLRDVRERFLTGGQGASDFAGKLKSVETQATSTSSKLGSLASKASGALSGVGGMITGALSVAGGNFITSILGGVKDKITGAIQTGFDFNKVKEKSLIGFEIKLGGRKEAEDFFNEINKFAEKAPQELDQVLESANRLMIAFKGKEVLYALDAITDAVAGQGKVGGEATEVINGIGLQLQQMLLKGKVSAEETTSLAERGVKAYKYLGDEIAKTDASFAALTDEQKTAKVQELGQKGLLSARTAVAVILRGMKAEYDGAAERIAKETLEGIEANTSDRLSRLAGQSTQNVFERYKVMRQKFLDSLNSSAGESMARGINSTAGSLIGAMDDAVAAISSGNLKQLGFDAISSAATGAAEAGKSLYSSGVGAANQLIGGVKDTLEMKSPSKVMRALGENAGASLVLGFQQGARRTFTEFKPEIEKLIETNAKRTGIDPDLIRSIMRQESRGKGHAVSHKGASGLMQLMPATARRFGVTNIFDPAQNVAAGADYLKFLLKRFRGDVRLALAGYNAGEGAVDKYGGKVPPYRETQDYVRKIMSDYERRQMVSGSSGGEWRGGERTREIVDLVNSHSDDLYARRAASEGEQLRKLLTERDTNKAAINAAMQDAQASLRWAESLPQSTIGQRDVRERLMYGATETIAAIQRDLDAYLNAVNAQINMTQARLQDAALKLGTDAPEGMTWQEQARAEGWQALPKIAAFDASGRLAGYDTPDDRPIDLSMRAGGISSVFGAAGASVRTATELNWQLKQTAQVLEQVKAAGQDAFGSLPPLINTAATEAKESAKQFDEFAERIAGTVAGSLDRLYKLDIRGFFTSTLNGFADLFKDIIAEAIKSRIKEKLLSVLNPDSASNSTGGGFNIGSAIKSLFGFGSKGGAASPLTGGFAGGSGAAAMISPAAVNAAGAAAGVGAGAGMAALMSGGTMAAGAAGVTGAAGMLTGGGAAAASTGAAAGGGLSMASLAAFASNPITLAVAGAAVAGFLLWKHFSHGTEKALRKTIRGEYGVDMRDMKMLAQIKGIGEETFGKGQVKKHLLETVRLEPAKELIGQYAESTGQQARGLTLNRELTDPGSVHNQFVRRIAGGIINGQTRGVDHVPVLADGGEYVLRSAVTSREGLDNLNALNDGEASVVSRNAWRKIRAKIEAKMREQAQKQASTPATPAASPSRPQSQQGGIPPSLLAAIVGALQGNAEALERFIETYKPKSRGQMLEAMAEENPETIGKALNESLRRGSLKAEIQESLGLRNW